MVKKKIELVVEGGEEGKQPPLEHKGKPLSTSEALAEKDVGEKIEKEVKKKIESIKKKAEEEALAETEEMLEKVEKPSEEGEFSEHGSVVFPCPQCGKSKIKRTFHERKIATKYKCPNCGFVGPN